MMMMRGRKRKRGGFYKERRQKLTLAVTTTAEEAGLKANIIGSKLVKWIHQAFQLINDLNEPIRYPN
jgi:hypothetical protein